jgi:hypothetical protein
MPYCQRCCRASMRYEHMKHGSGVGIENGSLDMSNVHETLNAIFSQLSTVPSTVYETPVSNKP